MSVVDDNIYGWIDKYLSGEVMTLPKKVIGDLDTMTDYCSEEYLNHKLNDNYPINKHTAQTVWNTADAGPKVQHKDAINWKDVDFSEKTKPLMKPVIEELEKYWSFVSLRNYLAWYKPQNYMGWHTNCKRKQDFSWKTKHVIMEEDYRLYLVWCDEDNKSFFRWRDPNTLKIHTKWENKGWNINWFKLGDCENPTWHCLYSDCNRFSIGFRVLNPIDKVLNEIQEG